MQDEEVDLVVAFRELPMLEKFPRFGLLLARQAEKQSRAALTPPLNGHEQARQRESQVSHPNASGHQIFLIELLSSLEARLEFIFKRSNLFPN